MNMQGLSQISTSTVVGNGHAAVRAFTNAAVKTPIAVAVVGTGYIAEYHLAVLRNLKEVEVVGACDPDTRRLDQLCERWSIPNRARSLEELLNRCKPNAVHLLVPPSLHFGMAKEALQIGLNVLVEKPLALRTQECNQLIELARVRNLVLGVNHNALYHPMFRRLIRDLSGRKLGRVDHVVAVQNLPLAQFQSGEHDHWMFRQPENILFEQGPHPLSQICELIGPVRRVTTLCSGETQLRTGTPFYPTWQLAMECERGTAQLYMAFAGSFPEWSLEVIGQDGSAHLDLLNNTYVLDRRTPSVPPIDIFRRVLHKGRQIAGQAVGGLLRYGFSTLRLMGRSDPYYQSMRGSIEAFHESLLGGNGDCQAAKCGGDVIEGLELAAKNIPRQRHFPPISSPAAFVRPEEVLVLGSTGFIGRRVVVSLTEAGYPVRVMVRKPALLPDEVKRCQPSVFSGDIRNAEEVNRATEGCRAVIHLVAGAPSKWSEFERLFVEGTRNVARACLEWRVPKLHFVSSISAYYLGKHGVTITEDTPLDPYPERRCEYSRAKILCEQLLGELHRTNGLPVTIFRPGIVVGEGGPVEHLGVGMWQGATQCIGWGRLSNPLPFVLVDDVVVALVQALRLPELEGKAFNLVGDVRLTAEDYVQALRQESQRDVRLHRRSVPGWRALELLSWFVKAVGRKQDNKTMSWRELAYRTAGSRFDCTYTKKILGWNPVGDRERFIELGIRRALQGGSG